MKEYKKPFITCVWIMVGETLKIFNIISNLKKKKINSHIFLWYKIFKMVSSLFFEWYKKENKNVAKMFLYQTFDLNSVVYLRFENNFISIFYSTSESTLKGMSSYMFIRSLIRNKSKQEKTLEMNSNQVVLFAHSPRERDRNWLFQNEFFLLFYRWQAYGNECQWKHIETLFLLFVSFSPVFLYFIVIDDSFSFPLVYLSNQYCAPVAFGHKSCLNI